MTYKVVQSVQFDNNVVFLWLFMSNHRNTLCIVKVGLLWRWVILSDCNFSPTELRWFVLHVGRWVLCYRQTFALTQAKYFVVPSPWMKAFPWAFPCVKTHWIFDFYFPPMIPTKKNLKYKIGRFKKRNALYLFEMRGLCIGKITLGNMSS
jgi:hypothetical protein